MDKLAQIREGIRLKMESMVMHHAYLFHEDPDDCQTKSLYLAIRALDEVRTWIDDKTGDYPTAYRLERYTDERKHWEKLLEEKKSKK